MLATTYELTRKLTPRMLRSQDAYGSLRLPHLMVLTDPSLAKLGAANELTLSEATQSRALAQMRQEVHEAIGGERGVVQCP